MSNANNRILNDIEKKICHLEDEERQSIEELLVYHEAEPMAAAERISELLGVSYQSIFDIL